MTWAKNNMFLWCLDEKYGVLENFEKDGIFHINL